MPFQKGHKNGMLGKHHSEKTKRKMSNRIPWNKGKKLPQFSGENHGMWKGGLSQTREYKNISRKEWRHRLGISKKYRGEYPTLTKKQNNQLYKRRVRMGGKLTIDILQRVYEDNIKKYGTLTCIYCLNPIEFGKDSLEHKQPLSRGGTNIYENLAIACQRCNCRKHNKTEIEYRKEQKLCSQ